jgi:hypothetical protein
MYAGMGESSNAPVPDDVFEEAKLVELRSRHNSPASPAV